MKKNYNSIDLVKFLMSFLVVAIHTVPTIYAAQTMPVRFFEAIQNIAVPFFFLESGFLLGKTSGTELNSKEAIEKISSRRNGIIRMYVIWTIIYLPLTIIHYVTEGEGVFRSVLLFTHGFFLMGEHYNSWMLWYLLSMIYALSMVKFLLRRKKSIMTVFMAGILFLILSYLIDMLVEMENMPYIIGKIRYIIRYSIVNGRIFKGFFYIPCGLFISTIEFDKYKNISIVIAVISFAISFMVQGVVSYLAFPLSVIAFVIFINSVNLADNKAYMVLRKISTVIYFIHLYVWTILYMLIYGKKTYGVLPFVLTCIISLLIAIIAILYKSKKRGRAILCQ